DENIRRRLARRQPRPLRYAELVLLVDHRQSEVLERNPFIKQRMRPHDNVRFFFRLIYSPIKQRQWTALLLPRTGPQGDSHAERLEPATENGVMLFGENLRRCHEGGLGAGFHGEKDGG